MKRFEKLKVLVALGALLLVPAAANGQLGWFDFDGPANVPDELPDDPDGYLLQFYGPNGAPEGTLVRVARDGAIFEDPFGGENNQSAAIDNNDHGFAALRGDADNPSQDGPTNVHMGWNTSVWPLGTDNTGGADGGPDGIPDAPFDVFNNGRIEFDFYMDPAPDGGRTSTDLRLGYRNNSVFVSTGAADTAGAFVFTNTDNGDDPDNVSLSYRGGNLPGSIGVTPGEVTHVQIDLSPPGAIPVTTMQMRLNGVLVEWTTDAGVVDFVPHMGTEGITGMNVMSFVGGFFGADPPPHGIIYVDNVHMSPEPGSCTLALLGAMVLLGLRRRVT